MVAAPSSVGCPVTFPKMARWGIGVVALHNAEEALTIPTWLPPRLAQLQSEFRIQPLAASSGRLYVGLVLATVVPAIWVAAARRSAPRTAGAYSVLVLYGVFLANAFVPHLAGALLLAGYVPGAITAGLLVVPFVLGLARRAVADGYATPRGAAFALVAAAAIYAPGVYALLGR
jgi:uncharacterized protein with HXXEE motif